MKCGKRWYMERDGMWQTIKCDKYEIVGMWFFLNVTKDETGQNNKCNKIWNVITDEMLEKGQLTKE